MPDMADMLEAQTTGLHERLEALPFFTALAAGTLRRAAIISFLRCLSIIHGVLEHSLSSISSRPISSLRRHTTPKLPLLVADLEALDAERSPIVSAAISGALNYAAEILTNGDNPLTLAGILYVLEGSQNGGVVLKKAYARCLGVPQDQLSYFGCYGSTTVAHWKGFIGCVGALDFGEHQVAEVGQSAVRCFEQLESVCAKLYPYDDPDLRHHVATVNFEAGDHAMPQDPLDIALALRVSRNAWIRYPYLERRFGERGKRYTSSDSCWLVALRRQSAESATRNLDWLRTVLARRGLPTIILESQLAAISQEFSARLPEQPQPPVPYEPFLSMRAAERRALLDTERETRVLEEFDRRLRACVRLTVESTARLITSAWVDERSGIDGALASVRDWFVEEERFSSDWIANIHELVETLDNPAKPSC